MTAGAAQVASVLPDLTRPPSGRGLRIQPQVRQDLLDHRPLEDGRDDLQFPAAAVRAVLHIDVEDPLEQPRQADAVRSGEELGRRVAQWVASHHFARQN